MNRRNGFTFVEMAIIIVVLGILALIVIPRIIHLGRKAKEAALRAELHQLRSAIQQFEADCGDYPARLEDIQVRPKDDKGGAGLTLDLKAWRGPYYAVVPHGMLPMDPMTDEPNWKYNPPDGDVGSAATSTALNGTKYSEW